MKRIVLAALLVLAGRSSTAGEPRPLEAGFVAPPAAARPWVYWFWLNGNITKEGMTADLEAMQRVGIGGVLIMEVDQGAPAGSVAFGGPKWRELYKHMLGEAARLGLEVNMNNDAGWCGSGGPWITPALSMQRVVWTETVVTGPKAFAGVLARPPAVRDFYRDIAVLAMPAPQGKARMSIEGKSSAASEHFPPQRASFASLPRESLVPHARIVDLTRNMDSAGRLAWNVPEGKWLVLRFGHTSTGVDNHPAPAPGRGLECDKLSREAAETQFNGLMGRLIADNRSLAGKGRTLVSTHIDSWEVGSQNWTPRMREEFQKRRGYDMVRYLPVFTGRAVDSLEVSERFLWDLRQTVSDMLIENYAGHFRRLANRHGLRLSIEAYDGVPCDEMSYAGQADEPMAEFWSWDKFGAAYSCTEMSSAAHVYGKRILGAEAFTATDGEKWLGHPASIKDLGDWAFCEGINRFVFHRYAMQPWTDPTRAPGMSMGPWGLHYERTQTWWEQSRAWHEYLARCQCLLQQGLFVADVCYLQPEGAPRRFAPPPAAMSAPHVRGGYNFDGCTPEVVLTRMAVKDGRLVLPDSMSYRVLVLPQVETMTPALLGKIKELVEAGATVVAPSRPRKSPGLSNYPACDEQVKRLAAEIWGTGAAPAEVSVRRLGKGRIVWGGALNPPPAAAPAAPSQFGLAQWIWYNDGDPAASAPRGKRYFRRVVTLAAGSRIVSAQLAMTADNEFVCYINGRRVGAGNDFHQAYTSDVAAALKPGANLIAVDCTNTTGSPTAAGLIGLLSIKLGDDQTIEAPTDRSWEASTNAAAGWNSVMQPAKGWIAAMQCGPLGMAPWGEVGAAPAAEVFAPATAVHQWLAKDGLPPDFYADRSLRYTHRRIGAADVYFVANGAAESCEATCSFRVTGKQPELWQPENGSVAPLLWYQEKDGCTNVPLRLGPTEAVFVVFRRAAVAAARVLSIRNRTGEGAGGGNASPLDFMRNEITQPGRYVLTMADGRHREIDCRRLAAPLPIGGPWEVAFDPKWGGPRGKDEGGRRKAEGTPVIFEKLEDWSKRAEEGIKHYSGTARYRTTFKVRGEEIKAPAPSGKGAGGEGLQPHVHWYLDLGKVAVMAEVRINGQDLGIAWKAPYRVDATKAVKAGENVLEVKVVNLWINRQIGDEQLPDDCDRNPDGTLKSWPAWLQEGKPSPTGRYTFSSWKLWKKGDPLQESGLLGPVTLQQTARLN